MKRMIIIFCIIIIGIFFFASGCIALKGKNPNLENPESTLTSAFKEDVEIREIFIEIANASVHLADDARLSLVADPKNCRYYYDYYGDGTQAFYYYDRGVFITDDSLGVDEKTAAAIEKLRTIFPGISIAIHPIRNVDRMSITFSIHRSPEEDSRYAYQDMLIHSQYDLSDLEGQGYVKIEEGWYYSIWVDFHP